jgi:quinol-cytochrome oxidoreductase complex cytochrome b subunit
MSMTERLQKYTRDKMTLDDILPTKLPTYVNSVAYLFGVFTLCSLVMMVITGVIMAAFGPNWYHISGTGRFFNTMHFWGAQLFFGFMVLHLSVKYFLGAFRDGRWKTWMIGVLTMGVAIFTGFTGYLSASTWSSQWHSVQAKDAMNAMGVGGFFFTTNYGQVLTLHVAVFPFVIIVLVVTHILFIRHESPVKPYPAKGEKAS